MLPIEQSPEITPPTVDITARYPGANAEVVAESIATPIEQELSGIENLLYYQSQSANDGSLTITLTFEIGSDLDIAAVETLIDFQAELMNKAGEQADKTAEQAATLILTLAIAALVLGAAFALWITRSITARKLTCKARR